MSNKKEFNIIDLGNNVRRFGLWQDYINWHDAFRFPDRFLESRISEMEDLQFEVDYLFYNKVIETREMVTESEEHGTTIHSQQYAEDAAENYCLGYMAADGRPQK